MEVLRTILILAFVTAFSAPMSCATADPVASLFDRLDAAESKSSVLLTNATIFVGDGGAPFFNHAVLIEGGSIVAVAPLDAIDVPVS
ncbi:MAG: hypothetical protein WBN09_06550 [Woeseiaceae bacterium]